MIAALSQFCLWALVAMLIGLWVLGTPKRTEGVVKVPVNLHVFAVVRLARLDIVVFSVRTNRVFFKIGAV